ATRRPRCHRPERDGSAARCAAPQSFANNASCSSLSEFTAEPLVHERQVAGYIVDSNTPRVLACPVARPPLPGRPSNRLGGESTDGATVRASKVLLEVDHVDLTVRVAVRDQKGKT